MSKISKSIEILEALMMKIADIEFGDSDKDTPLHGAAAYNNIVAVKALLKSGANVNARNNNEA